MPSYLVTGSSRGLGLAFVGQLVSFLLLKASQGMELRLFSLYQLDNPENYVIATARNPSTATELQALLSKFPKSRAVLLQLDAGSPESIENAAVEVLKLLPEGLDTLVANAGVNDQPTATFGELSVPPISLF
jgi:NAD(P)-dependent dehydrogenase (short-subunit alcohol dehydrogenase family)